MKFHASPTEESSTISNLQSPIQKTPQEFSFRTYQKEDLPRAAMHDGAIIAWDPGLGKTMAIFTLPMLKRAKYALIVAPGGLHEQIIDEGRTKFGTTVTPIPDQATAYRLMREGKLPFPANSRIKNPESREAHPSHGYDLSALPADIANDFSTFLNKPSRTTFDLVSRWNVLHGFNRHFSIDDQGNMISDRYLSTREISMTFWQACCAVDIDFPLTSGEITDSHFTPSLIDAALSHVGIHKSPSAGSSLPSTLDVPRSMFDVPTFFITSYTALGYNGADEWNPGEPNELIRARRLTILARNRDFPDADLARDMAAADWKFNDKIDDWTALSLPPDSSADRIRTALRTAAMLFHPHVQPDDGDVCLRWLRIFTSAAKLLNLSRPASDILENEIATDPAVLSASSALSEIEQGIGHEKDIGDGGLGIRESDESHSSPISNLQSPTHIVRCVFTPTLASIICGVFDFTVCDEAVRLKSGTSFQAQGILRMASRFRYALTGTPIKNKLPDLFFLASWVTGHTPAAIARWPYGNGVEDRGQFSRDFGVIEQNLTKQELASINGKKAPPPKTTNHICNVHRLWRILGPVVIRRRKDQVKDATIVTKTIVPIRVMPGKEQHATYSFHLRNAPEKRSILASIGAQLQNLRQAALNPSTIKLAPNRSQSAWTPKFTAILKLTADLLAKGEQVVIFSPFTDFSASIADRLRDAGVKHLLLDGNITPAKRGSLIKKFKSREVPVLIAGIDSMGEGHNLDNARHLILPSLSWAFDSNTQAVERVHRLTSQKPVTIYVMVTTGTIDERLTSIWQEKGDSSDLALDGRLITTEREEIDLGQLLRDAVEDFDPKAATLDEVEVAAHWKSTLLPELTAAGKSYLAISQAAVTITPPPATHIPDPAPTITHRPRSLFDLMKNKNKNTPRHTPAPEPKPENQPQAPAPNIIPFPGRLAATNTPKPYSMQKVNFAQLLRRN